MSLFGTHNKRTHARLEVPRGFDPTLPSTFTQTAPVMTGVVIKSGQAIVLMPDNAHPSQPGRLAWTLADSALHAANDIFIALQDSTDEDIIGTDKLTGYATAGQFEFESAFFKADDTYTAGLTNLTIGTGATAGALRATAIGSGLPIIGRISRQSPKAIGAINSNVPANAQVICWRTGYLTNQA